VDFYASAQNCRKSSGQSDHCRLFVRRAAVDHRLEDMVLGCAIHLQNRGRHPRTSLSASLVYFANQTLCSQFGGASKRPSIC